MVPEADTEFPPLSMIRAGIVGPPARGGAMRCRSRNRAGMLVVVLSTAFGRCRSASPVPETVDSAAGSTSISLAS